MKISFKDRKLQKFCENHKKLTIKYGNIKAEKIIRRINELSSSENLYDISRLPQARLHLLKNNWKGHFAVDISHPYRLILRPINGNKINLKSITSIQIIMIIDYH